MFNMFKSKPTQFKNKTQYVLSLMQNGEGVSQYKLYENHFFHGYPMPTRLSAVIFNLKKKYPVKKRTVKYFDKATGKHNEYAEYYI